MLLLILLYIFIFFLLNIHNTLYYYYIPFWNFFLFYSEFQEVILTDVNTVQIITYEDSSQIILSQWEFEISATL